MSNRRGQRAETDLSMPPPVEVIGDGNDQAASAGDDPVPAVEPEAPAEPVTQPSGGGSYVRDRDTGHLTRQEA